MDFVFGFFLSIFLTFLYMVEVWCMMYFSTNTITDFSGICRKSFLLPICFNVDINWSCNYWRKIASDFDTCTISILQHFINIFWRSFSGQGNHLWTSFETLPKKFSSCCGNFQKAITQSPRLLVRPYDIIGPCSISRLARKKLNMEPSTSISRIITLKHMTAKIIIHLMNSLIANIV